VGKKIFMSYKTSLFAILVHSLVFATGLYFLNEVEGFQVGGGAAEVNALYQKKMAQQDANSSRSIIIVVACLLAIMIFFIIFYFFKKPSLTNSSTLTLNN
jgi:hypothetical protein